MSDAQPKFVLPLAVVGPADVNHLQLELEMLEDYLRQLGQTGQPVKLPKLSRMLDSLAEYNEADLLQQIERDRLTAFLAALQEHAPRIHISFATEPSGDFTQKVLQWLRENISSYILLQIGLQPTIAAGCVVRTTNKIFDMSLRQYLDNNRHLLSEAIRKLEAGSGGGNSADAGAGQSQAEADVAVMPVSGVAA